MNDYQHAGDMLSGALFCFLLLAASFAFGDNLAASFLRCGVGGIGAICAVKFTNEVRK